jgi:hypothetical protein
MKIRKCFVKHHLGIDAVHAIFSTALLRRIQTSASHCATNCSITASPRQATFLLSMKSVMFFCVVHSNSPDAMQRKQAWIVTLAELFKDQQKFTGGKPSVLCLDRCKEAIARDFGNLMKTTNKKTPADHTMDDNATLIRCRVMCFNRTKLCNGKKMTAGRKAQKLMDKELSKTTNETLARPQKKLSIDTPSASVQPKDAAGFFDLRCVSRQTADCRLLLTLL